MHWENNQPKAIPFIVKDHNNTYTLTQQAIQFLTQLQGPLAVITVAGLYRTGKSYLLNRVILNRANGFGVGPTVNPCTKGLWLWAEPIRAPEGRTLLVVDTEGLGALDEQSNHDMKIFSLAVLLSTNFIYNSVGSIDETALQTLSLALQLIGSIDPQNYSSRPSLLWVIRDFSLELINNNGESITSSQYLQLALSTEHLKQSSKVQIRKVINQAFSKRDCFTLIKPLIDEQKLQNLDKIAPEELRPEFVSQTITLRKQILNSLKDIKLNQSGSLTGKQYSIMIEKYLAAINANQMPNLMDTWSFIRAEKARVAVEMVRENYNQKLRVRLGSRFPMPSVKLQETLDAMRKQTLQQFFNLSYEETVHPDLQEFFSMCEQQMNRVNAKQTKNVVNDMLRREFEPFQKKLLSDYYNDINAYENELRSVFSRIQQKIAEKLDLPSAEIDLFTQRKIVEGAKLFERKAKDQIFRVKQLKVEAESSLQNELRIMSKNIEDEKKRYQEELLSAEKKIIILTSQKKFIEETREKERREEVLESQKFRKKTEENQSALEILNSQIQKLSAINAEQERTIFSIKKQSEKQKALNAQRQEYINTKQQEQEKRIQQLTQDYQRDLKNWQNQKKQLSGSNQSKIKFIVQENKELADQLLELTHQFQHQQYLNNQQQQQIATLKSKYQEDIQRYKEKLHSSNRKQIKRDDEQLQLKLQETSELLQRSQKTCKDWEYRYKQLNEELKSSHSNFEKELAIFTQKIEFQQIEISQLKNKNQQLNHSYQRYLEHAHTGNQGVEEMYVRKMNEMQQEQQQTLKAKEEQLQRKTKEFKKQIMLIVQAKENLELQLALEKKKNSDKEHQLQESLKRAEKAYEAAIQRLNSAEIDQEAVAKEKEQFYQSRIKQLERELEVVSEKTAIQLEQISKKSEENLNILKNYSDIERTQLQKRLQEEKEKSNKKLNELNDEWTKRLTQEREVLQNNLQQLVERLEMTEMEANEKLQTMKCDNDIKLQKLNNQALQERMELTKKIALLTQQAQMNKTSLMAQLEEKTKTYQQHLESLKKELTFQYEQQIKNIKDALEESQKRSDGLRKSNRKAEDSNMLLKAELDKEKSVFREKLENVTKERRELQERYRTETQNQNKIIEQLSSAHSTETRRLNNDIEKLRQKLCEAQEAAMKTCSNHEQEKNSYITKINYLDGKIKRSKTEYEDLLNKFEVTVKTLSKNNKSELEKEFQDRLQKMKDDYNRKIGQKEESINNQRKQKDDKMIRLQTENKTLRDKLLILEMRESGKKGRNEEYEVEFNRMQEHYERKFAEMKQQIQKYARLYKQTRDEKEQLENSIRMEKSRISDRSERHSFINEGPVLDVSVNKGLRQNKSLINYRLPAGTSTKKQEKRYTNAEEFTGIMKWPH